MNKATLRLFNAIQVPKFKVKSVHNLLLDQTVKNGYVLSPQVAAVASPNLLKEIESIIGISGEKANNTFHKSWEKVRTAPLIQLYVEQMIHYIGTYGMESLGLDPIVLIPAEALNVPEPSLTGDLRLVLIQGLTKEEIFEKMKVLVGGIALSNEVLNDIMEIEQTNNYGQALIDVCKNRELKIRLYDFHDLVPSDPEEFLKFVIYKLTGETLIIKNPNLIKKIKESVHRRWLDEVALPKAPFYMGAIWHRYKPLWLAMRSLSKNKSWFNRLRRLAERQHIPVAPPYLNTVTERIQKGQSLSALTDHLKKANIWRKVRLAQALNYRTHPGNSIVYRIRNGKGWVEDFSFSNTAQARSALWFVIDSIAAGLKVRGQVFYMPDSVELALPATEKQFIGNIPMGSYIKTAEDMIAGIHWNNVGSNRIDLDLSSIAIDGKKVGWDAHYRSNNILFSGDMTDAGGPKGATELLYFPNKPMSGGQLLSVNYYNHQATVPVPATIMVAHDSRKPKGFGESTYSYGSGYKRESHYDYMVDPNHILAVAKTTVSEQQTILGMVLHVNGQNRFYFVNTTMGKSRSMRQGKYVQQTQQYLLDSLESVISLRDVLTLAGASVVTSRPEMGEYVDLSPEALDKSILIKILTQ